MKDYAQQFDELNERVEKLFEAGFWQKLKGAAKSTAQKLSGVPFEDSPEEKKRKKNLKAGVNRTYVSNTSSASNYASSIETGEECKPGKSNGRFYSEIGSNSAVFYSLVNNKVTPTGFVNDIKPFLDNAGISKKILRCYNLEKDPLRIAWLFNGAFKANMLDWDKKKRKVLFHGDWKGGGGAVFGGILQGAEEKAANSPLLKQYKIVKKGQEIGPFTANDIINLISKEEAKRKEIEKKTPGVQYVPKYTVDSIIRALDSTDYQRVKDDKTLSYLLKTFSQKQPTSNIQPSVGFAAKSSPANEI
jgi:hypothetical protein